MDIEYFGHLKKRLSLMSNREMQEVDQDKWLPVLIGLDSRRACHVHGCARPRGSIGMAMAKATSNCAMRMAEAASRRTDAPEEMRTSRFSLALPTRRCISDALTLDGLTWTKTGVGFEWHGDLNADAAKCDHELDSSRVT